MRNGRAAGAVAGGLLAGLGITAMLMLGERRSGEPSELIELERASARRLGLGTPRHGLPGPEEQAVTQGGHLLLSGLAGAAYAAATGGRTNPVIGGVLFGLAFYVSAHVVAGPLLGVKRPEWRQPRGVIGMHALNHVAFGLVTAFAARFAAGRRQG